MLRAAVCIALVVALAAQPAMAQTPGGGGGALWDLLAQLQDLFGRFRSWVGSQFSTGLDAVRAKLAPITDTRYASDSIARWLEGMMGGLPAELRSLLSFFVGRFRDPAGPPAGSVSEAARQIIEQQPSSELASTVRAHEELSAATDASVARARGAQQVAEDTSSTVSSDMSMATNLEAASASARELAARAAETPSTRAAVQLLIEGFAAFMDQNARQNADLSARLTALVQQQAALSQQLTSVAEQAAALVELLNQQRKREAEQEAVAAKLTVTSALNGVGTALGGVASIAPDDRSRQSERQMYDSISNLYGGR